MKKGLLLIFCVIFTFALVACGNKESDVTVSADGYIIIDGIKTEYKVQEGASISVIDGFLAINGVKTEYKVDKADVIEVKDGYLVVNGVKTEYEINKDDVIEVVDGYLVVNGVKTEHKIFVETTLSVIDGYVAVNGVKTEYEVNTADVVEVIDGYLVVNGVKTDHEVKNKNHSFGDWKVYNENETNCEKKLYYRTCPDCSTIEWKEGAYQDHDFESVTTNPTCTAVGFDTKTCKNCGKTEKCNETPIAPHDFKKEYSYDNSFHWFDCKNCDAINSKADHEMGNDGLCAACGEPLAPTEGLIYEVSQDGTYAELIGYEGTATKILIASEYQGLPVKTIYKEAFKEKSINSVIIPDSVEIIGNYAFSTCGSLKSVVIGNSVETIGDFAFFYCTSLASITIPDSVETISNYAFYYCTSLASITIPDSVKAIGNYAFSHCAGLVNVTIGNSVETIGEYAFQYTSLASITIPDSVKAIGSYAFLFCRNLASVSVGNFVTIVGLDTFFGCNSALYKEEGTLKYVGDENNPYAILIEATNKNLSAYSINRATKIIACGVFSGSERLSTITIPNSVKTISYDAFYDCTSLVSITIPNSVKTISYYAFYNCDSLTDVYYTGTEAEWAGIEIDSNNYPLETATKHYNYVIPEE